MEDYNVMTQSLENNTDMPEVKRTAETLEALQSVIDEKQRLLDKALEDLSKGKDCKYCANVGQCSSHCVERNLAYGGCSKWQWRGGAKLISIAS